MSAIIPLRSALPALRPAAAAALEVTPDQLIENWLASLSPSSKRSYRRGLKRFALWALSDDAEPVAAVRMLCNLDVGRAGEMVRRWSAELTQTGMASSTVAAYVVAVTSVIGACRRAGLVSWRLEQVAPRIEPRQDRSGPRRGDVERIFAVIDEHADTGDKFAIRDAALLRLLYLAALRRSEAVGLRVEDVEDTDVGPVVKARRKGKKERQPIIITTQTASSIERWLEVRGREPGPLFLRCKARTATSGPLSGEAVRRIVALWAKRAGIKGAVRPHGLRHAAATYVAQKASLAELMAIGGWASMSAARRYLDAHAADRQKALAILEL